MEKTSKKWFASVFYGLLALIPILLFFQYLFAAVLPFALAFIAASVLYRPSVKISGALNVSYRAVAVGLTVLSVSVFMGVFGLLLWQTLSEVGDFAGATLGGENGILENLSGVLRRLGDLLSGLPFFSEKNAESLRESLTQAVSDAVKNLLISAAARFPAFAAKLVSAIPQIFVFFVVTVLSAVYFCVDYEKIRGFLKKRLSEERWRTVRLSADVLKRTAVQFVKSYLVLFLVTFAGLFFGFIILGREYAFLLALITAAVDSLPIFGMGAVLFPLALYDFMIGEIAYGIGICVLYLILTVARQVLEPKLLGAGTGIHPLVMLMSMYCGWKLFGIAGMLFAPFCTVTVKNLFGMRGESKT